MVGYGKVGGMDWDSVRWREVGWGVCVFKNMCPWHTTNVFREQLDNVQFF